MIWQDEMKRDAVRVAFPDWQLSDTDTITVSAIHNDSYGYDDDWESESFGISVTVLSNSARKHHFFEGAAAASFFTDVMLRSSVEETAALDVMTRIAEREALTRHRRDLTTSRQSYENAMYYSSINEWTRKTIHNLAQNYREGRPIPW
jgi:hypothetical protein